MITSTANAKVKHLANLKRKRKLRDEEGVFLVEGIRMFRETPKMLLKEVYASESFYKKERRMTDEALKGSEMCIRDRSRRFWRLSVNSKILENITDKLHNCKKCFTNSNSMV